MKKITIVIIIQFIIFISVVTYLSNVDEQNDENYKIELKKDLHKCCSLSNQLTFSGIVIKIDKSWGAGIKDTMYIKPNTFIKDINCGKLFSISNGMFKIDIDKQHRYADHEISVGDSVYKKPNENLITILNQNKENIIINYSENNWGLGCK